MGRFLVLVPIIGLTFFIVVEAVLLIRTIIHLAYSLKGSVFEPSTEEKINSILKLADPQPDEKIVDLGSGDGELLIAFAKKGFEITGVEMNPLLISEARDRIKKRGLDDLITIEKQDFFQMDLSKYDLVVLYCPQHIMRKLQPKLKKELKPGSRIVSNYFQFFNWEPVQVENEVKLYIQGKYN